WSGGEAAFLALDEKAQQTDLNAWTRAYLVADRSAYPSTWRIREHLPGVADDEIFETSLSFMLAGLAGRAPNPCTCGAHPGGTPDGPLGRQRRPPRRGSNGAATRYLGPWRGVPGSRAGNRRHQRHGPGSRPRPADRARPARQP